MSTFKTISSADIKTTKSNLNQLVDFVEEDISGSSTRKKFQVFVTSSGVSAITSSLFHTVYDQDFSLQTANELFDLTFGIYSGSQTVVTASQGIDVNGKLLFSGSSVMMREKVNIYRQFSQLLLGDATQRFTSPFSNSTLERENMDEILFITLKRLFVRDGIKRESFAMRLFASSSEPANDTIGKATNLHVLADHQPRGSVIVTDVGAASSIERSQFGGDVGNLVLANNTAENVGLIFYQHGIVALDMKRAFDGTQQMSGSIPAVGIPGKLKHIRAGGGTEHTAATATDGTATILAGHAHISASFVPHFISSGSIDTVLDHIATTRFSSGSQTFMTFQNNTQINSTLIFCRATADEFNYTSNPTYTDSDGRIVVIDESQQGIQKSFSFVSTIGLYDANEELLAVAKLSRPVEKNDEKDLTFRVRLDF